MLDSIQKKTALLLAGFAFAVWILHMTERAVRGAFVFEQVDGLYTGLVGIFLIGVGFESRILKALQILSILGVGIWEFSADRGGFGLVSFVAAFFLLDAYGFYGSNRRGRIILTLCVGYGIIITTQVFHPVVNWIAAGAWLLHVTVFVSLIGILLSDKLIRITRIAETALDLARKGGSDGDDTRTGDKTGD